MVRDLSSISRDLENSKNLDIIFKKKKVREALEQDPDIDEVLGIPQALPLNKYADAKNPTEEELKRRQEIIDFNEKIKHPRIIDFLKLNDIQTEVNNFIMFDIDDVGINDYNEVIKTQYLIVMCLVNENAMETEYGIARTDLLGYIVKDIFDGSNVLGNQLIVVNDRPQIIDTNYYCRTIKFKADVPNNVMGRMPRTNKYDRFKV